MKFYNRATPALLWHRSPRLRAPARDACTLRYNARCVPTSAVPADSVPLRSPILAELLSRESAGAYGSKSPAWGGLRRP